MVWFASRRQSDDKKKMCVCEWDGQTMIFSHMYSVTKCQVNVAFMAVPF